MAVFSGIRRLHGKSRVLGEQGLCYSGTLESRRNLHWHDPTRLPGVTALSRGSADSRSRSRLSPWPSWCWELAPSPFGAPLPAPRLRPIARLSSGSCRRVPRRPPNSWLRRPRASRPPSMELIDQLQMVQDQLQTVRRLLASQQTDTKKLSEQVATLTEAIDGLGNPMPARAPPKPRPIPRRANGRPRLNPGRPEAQTAAAPSGADRNPGFGVPPGSRTPPAIEARRPTGKVSPISLAECELVHICP